jgi:hypothetical protein
LPSERWLPRGFLILLLAVLALAGWQWRHGAPLSANLMELVPGDTPDALELSAEQRMQEPLNREMLVLVGHAASVSKPSPWPEQLGERNGRPAACLKRSSGTCKPTCPALREQLLQGRVAMLSAKPTATS